MASSPFLFFLPLSTSSVSLYSSFSFPSLFPLISRVFSSVKGFGVYAKYLEPPTKSKILSLAPAGTSIVSTSILLPTTSTILTVHKKMKVYQIREGRRERERERGRGREREREGEGEGGRYWQRKSKGQGCSI